jgi:hypothetical protein
VAVLAGAAVVVGEFFVGVGMVGFGISAQPAEALVGWELGAEVVVAESVQP